MSPPQLPRVKLPVQMGTLVALEGEEPRLAEVVGKQGTKYLLEDAHTAEPIRNPDTGRLELAEPRRFPISPSDLLRWVVVRRGESKLSPAPTTDRTPARS